MAAKPNLSSIEALIGTGWDLIPLETGQKTPRDKGWRRIKYTADEIRAWAGRGGNVGVRLRPDQVVLDYDPRNDFIGDSLARFAREHGIGSAPVTETPTGGVHVFLRKPADTAIRAKLDDYPGLDVKTGGTQVVAAGSVHPHYPDGPLYQHRASTPPFTAAPEIPASALAAIRRPEPKRSSEPAEISPEKLRAILAEVDPCLYADHDTWLQLMMAAHSGTKGDPEAREIFIEWSTQDPAYAQDDHVIRHRWDSLDANRAGGITVATLYKLVGPEHVPARPAAEAFADAPIEEPGEEQPPANRMDRDKHGMPMNTVRNVILAVQDSGVRPALDLWRDRIELTGDMKPIWPRTDRVWTDTAMHLLRKHLIGRYRLQTTLDRVQEAVTVLAAENAFNPLTDWLQSIEWDGKLRLDSWLTRITGAPDTPYTRWIGRLTLIGAVARAMEPGVKFDTMLIIEGDQGIGKSRLVRAIGGEYTIEGLPLRDLKHKDVIEAIRNAWVVELDELVAMRRAEVESLKSFVSTNRDKTRLAYARNAEEFPRKCILIGTTNEGEYLADSTGARRFWPIRAPGHIDVEGFLAERDQLFGEAYKAWMENPHPAALMLPAAVQPMAVESQSERYEEDSWQEQIDKTLREKFEGVDWVGTTDVLSAAMRMDLPDQRRQDRVRLANVMQRLGWRRGRCQHTRRRGWVRPS